MLNMIQTKRMGQHFSPHPGFVPQAIAEKGFTLIEALIAIVIVGITLSFITPMVFLSVATEAQNRKIQQAGQLAQGEVDRVRIRLERGNYSSAADNIDFPADAGVANLNLAPVPTGVTARLRSTTATCNTDTDGEQVPLLEALQVDIDGDCTADFLVQVFRDAGVRATVDADSDLVGFSMGVRVYAARAADNMADGTLAFDGVGDPAATPPVPPQGVSRASITATTGFGRQDTQPLSVLYSTIIDSNNEVSLDQYRRLIQ